MYSLDGQSVNYVEQHLSQDLYLAAYTDSPLHLTRFQCYWMLTAFSVIKKNDIKNIVQEKRNEHHRELRSLFALEEKQIITTLSTLHCPTPSPFLPYRLLKICDISKPSHAVTFSGGFQEMHINYEQPTNAKDMYRRCIPTLLK